MNRSPIISEVLSTVLGLAIAAGVYGSGIGLLYVGYLIAGGAA